MGSTLHGHPHSHRTDTYACKAAAQQISLLSDILRTTSALFVVLIDLSGETPAGHSASIGTFRIKLKCVKLQSVSSVVVCGLRW